MGIPQPAWVHAKRRGGRARFSQWTSLPEQACLAVFKTPIEVNGERGIQQDNWVGGLHTYQKSMVYSVNIPEMSEMTIPLLKQHIKMTDALLKITRAGYSCQPLSNIAPRHYIYSIRGNFDASLTSFLEYNFFSLV